MTRKMAFEKRNGNSYYYRKKRVGQSVISEYIGIGETAFLLSQMDFWEHREKRIEAEKQRKSKERIEKIDQDIDEISEINRNLVDALFLANGFHQHKRQWRKKRK